MLDALRAVDTASRRTRRMERNLKATCTGLRQTLGRDPNDTEDRRRDGPDQGRLHPRLPHRRARREQRLRRVRGSLRRRPARAGPRHRLRRGRSGRRARAHRAAHAARRRAEQAARARAQGAGPLLRGRADDGGDRPRPRPLGIAHLAAALAGAVAPAHLDARRAQPAGSGAGRRPQAGAPPHGQRPPSGGASASRFTKRRPRSFLRIKGAASASRTAASVRLSGPTDGPDRLAVRHRPRSSTSSARRRGRLAQTATKPQAVAHPEF